MKALAVHGWASNFETHETRKLRRLFWVPIPNKQDGDGYTELLDHPDGAAHFGAWSAIVQVASKCETRGLLTRSGERAHDAASLARQTRIPEPIVAAALDRLLAIGWLEWAEICNSENLPPSRGAVPEFREKPPAASRKGPTEMNGPVLSCMDPKEVSPKKRFQPPSPAEVEAYLIEKGAPGAFSGEKFLAFYESKGWLVGKSPMKDWRAAVRTWLANQAPAAAKPSRYSDLDGPR